MRVCHMCLAGVEDGRFCPVCTSKYKKLKSAAGLTATERRTEMELLYGPLEIPFELVHARFEQLLGRPVFTHEMADSAKLLTEVGTLDKPSMDDIMAGLAGKTVIMIPSVGEYGNPR
jgi:hypothetical protein